MTFRVTALSLRVTALGLRVTALGLRVTVTRNPPISTLGSEPGRRAQRAALGPADLLSRTLRGPEARDVLLARRARQATIPLSTTLLATNLLPVAA